MVPYPPGGPLDITARVLAERVKDSVGSVVVDNRPGAGGNLGADLVAKAHATFAKRGCGRRSVVRATLSTWHRPSTA